MFHIKRRGKRRGGLVPLRAYRERLLTRTSCFFPTPTLPDLRHRGQADSRPLLAERRGCATWQSGAMRVGSRNGDGVGCVQRNKQMAGH